MLRYRENFSRTHLFTHFHLYPSVFVEMIQLMFGVLNVQIVLVPGFK